MSSSRFLVIRGRAVRHPLLVILERGVRHPLLVILERGVSRATGSSLRRIPLVMLVVASLVFVTPLPAHAQDARAEVQQLLDKRATAVRDHNENAFLATVDPGATDTFKKEQHSRYLGLQSIPVADYSLTVTEVDSGDLAPGLELDDKYATTTYMPETRESFRLGEYDERPMRNVFWYTYVERDGEWYFGAMDDARFIGLDATPNIWDEGAVAVQSSDRVLVLSASEQADRAKVVLDVAETAMSTFKTRWPLQWSYKIPIIVPSSPDQAARLLRTTAEVANFSAFTSYTPTRDEGWQASPPRLFAQEGNLATASVKSQVDTLVHEYTHAAAASLTGPNTPIWMQEGLAEWIRLDSSTSVNVHEGSARLLPDAENFVTTDATSLSRAYNQATAAMSFLADAKGPNAPIRLFEAAGKRRTVIGSPSYNADQVLQETTGWTTTEFLAAWQGR